MIAREPVVAGGGVAIVLPMATILLGTLLLGRVHCIDWAGAHCLSPGIRSICSSTVVVAMEFFMGRRGGLGAHAWCTRLRHGGAFISCWGLAQSVLRYLLGRCRDLSKNNLTGVVPEEVKITLLEICPPNRTRSRMCQLEERYVYFASGPCPLLFHPQPCIMVHGLGADFGSHIAS